MSIALVALVAIVLLLPKKAVVQSKNPPALSNDVVPEYQMFDYHAKKTMNLTSNLPSIPEFRENITQLVSNKEPFMRLMEGIAECDSAVMLKNQYGDRVVDLYNIEDQQTKLLNLRKGYLNTIMDDVNVLLDEGGAKFAHQDMEIAGILALPDEKPMLDSIKAVVKHNSK